MNDAVWQALIAAWVTITLAVINLWTAHKAAQKVERVKEALLETNHRTDGKLDSLADVTRDTHTLVNSNMAIQLRLNAAVTQRLADITKSPEDMSAAVLAAKLLKEHEAKQYVVDKASVSSRLTTVEE